MPADKRTSDDVLAPRRRATTDTASADPPDRATAKPELRDRYEHLRDEAQVVDVAPGLVADPPDAGPAHPIEVDIDRPELDLADREAVDSPFDGDDGATDGRRMHLPRKIGLDRPDDDDGFYAQVDGQSAGVFHALVLDENAVLAPDATSSFGSGHGFDDAIPLLADLDAEMHGREDLGGGFDTDLVD